MKKFQFFILILILLLGLTITFSCKYDKSDSAGQNSATITIHSPTDGTVFEKGDTIKINADVIGEMELHGWQVKIQNLDTGTTAFEDEADIHGTSLHIEAQWVNNVTEHSDMQLQLSVALDDEGDVQTKTVNFHCHPD